MKPKEPIVKSRYLVLVKFMFNLYDNFGFKGDMEIGLSEDEFLKFKAEDEPSLNKPYNLRNEPDYSKVNEFHFICSSVGNLRIYNKDAKNEKI